MSNFPVASTPANITPTDRSGTINGTVTSAYPSGSGTGYAVNDTLTMPGGVVLKVTGASSGGITFVSVTTPGNVPYGSIPANPVAPVSTSGSGSGAQIILNWLGVATQMAASNTSRRSLEVANPGTQTLWVSPTTIAGPGLPGSLPVYPGGAWSPPLPYSGAISVYGPTAGLPVTIFEG